MRRFEYDDEYEAFPFWTGAELTRIGVFLALAAIPLIVVHAEQANPVPDTPATISAAIETSGRLRSVHVSAFEVNRMPPALLADRDGGDR